MPLFFKEQKFISVKNGELVYRRFWDGSWILKIPEGENYSSTYLEKMWKKALEKLPEPLKFQSGKILILGSGAGCGVHLCHKFFPVAKIQAVDYDSAIIEIGKKIYQYFEQTSQIDFLESEAKNFVADADGKYDLILIDLFVGNRISPLLKDVDFLRGLKKISSPRAVIIANVASWLSGTDPKIFDKWFMEFLQVQIIRFKSNKLIIVSRVEKMA